MLVYKLVDLCLSIDRKGHDERGLTRHQVYVAIRDAIVRAELEPGQRLSENELAALTGVSRTPIREALARLRDDRLIDIIPQLGTFVTPISEQAIGDAQFVRESLECAAVRLAAERANADDVAALQAIVQSQEQRLKAEELERFYHFDDELHRAICDLSGHGIAWSLSQRASSHLNRIRRLSLTNAEYVAQMIAQHRTVIDAIERRDPDRAEAALRHHLRTVLSSLPELEATYPHYFAAERAAASDE